MADKQLAPLVREDDAQPVQPLVEVVVRFRSTGDGSFDGEILRGPDLLSKRDTLIAGLHFAYGLERNAKTDTEWREALRVWLMTVTQWMRVEGAPAELLSLPTKLNGYLEALEHGRQPPRLRAVPPDRRGAPGAGYVEVTRPATDCAIVDFLVAELRPRPQVAKIDPDGPCLRL
jgi:hypothetical protein